MKQWMRFSLLWIICLLLAACDDTPNYAPVADISNIEPIPKSGIHRVVQGETVYEIAWRYGLDYRAVVENNHIQAPYTIYSGQVVYLREPSPTPRIEKDIPRTEKPVLSARPIQYETPVFIEPNAKVSAWLWPAKGRIINSFSRLNKGINISGHAGDAIYAAAPGKVVYCGSGLRGYGNLIILKHNNIYLSAYAHNQATFVKEGEWVKQGQKIAEMGNIGSDKTMLHFEIRRAGKPIDPISLLKL